MQAKLENELKNLAVPYIHPMRPADERSKSTKCARFMNNQSPLMCNLNG